MIADILLVAAALGATFYCIVLSRRLSRFTDLEKGVGGAIATLSAQVDDMTRTLRSAQGAATASTSSLGDLTHRAEDAARRLELLVASMHDLPDPARAAPAREVFSRKPEPASGTDAVVPPDTAPEPEEPERPAPEAKPPAALFSSRRAGAGEAA